MRATRAEEVAPAKLADLLEGLQATRSYLRVNPEDDAVLAGELFLVPDAESSPSALGLDLAGGAAEVVAEEDGTAQEGTSEDPDEPRASPFETAADRSAAGSDDLGSDVVEQYSVRGAAEQVPADPLAAETAALRTGKRFSAAAPGNTRMPVVDSTEPSGGEEEEAALSVNAVHTSPGEADESGQSDTPAAQDEEDTGEARPPEASTGSSPGSTTGHVLNLSV